MKKLDEKMKICLDCIPCILRQTLETARLSTDNEKIQKKALNKIMSFLTELDSHLTPPHIGHYVYKTIREITGCKDPYHELKTKYNRIVLKMYPGLKEIVKNSPDPLLMAVRLTIAGNIIDFGANSQFDLDATLKEVLTKKFAVYHYDLFRDSLSSTKTLLYLGDNAGEIVFDKILIEEIQKIYKLKIYYAVKSGPVINDATLEDSNEVKMEEVAKVISNGSDAPGTILSLCSDKFLKIYNAAQMIISKGQGNYETLSESFDFPRDLSRAMPRDEETDKNIFLLLKVKCPLIAKHLEVKEGDIILKQGVKKWLH